MLALFSTQLDICWTGVFILQLVKMIKRFLMRGRLIMRKNTARNGIVITLAAMMAITAMTGCGKNASEEAASTYEGSVIVNEATAHLTRGRQIGYNMRHATDSQEQL